MKNNNAQQSLYGFTVKQIVLLIMLGIGFWLMGALTVNVGAPYNIFGGTAGIFLFIFSLPICWLAVLLMVKITGMNPIQIVPGISIGLAAATFFDGIVITWFTAFYGTNTEEVMLGSAWILWGAFAFLSAAFFEGSRRRKTNALPR